MMCQTPNILKNKIIIFFFGRETPLLGQGRELYTTTSQNCMARVIYLCMRFNDHSFMKRQLSLHMIMIN